MRLGKQMELVEQNVSDCQYIMYYQPSLSPLSV